MPGTYCFIYLNSLNPHNHPRRQGLLLCPFSRWGNQGSARLSDRPRCGSWHAAVRPPNQGFTSMALNTKLPGLSIDTWSFHCFIKCLSERIFCLVHDLIESMNTHTHTYTHSGTFSHAAWLSKLLKSFPFKVHSLIGFKTPYLTGWHPSWKHREGERRSSTFLSSGVGGVTLMLSDRGQGKQTIHIL